MKAIEFAYGHDPINEGWKDTMAHLGMIRALAGAGTGAMTVKQAFDAYMRSGQT